MRGESMAPLVCRPSISIREALERINANPHLFQIVVDEDGCVKGTVTDGDVRRAMLRGVGITDPVRLCMNARPKLGRIGADKENRSRVNRFFFLPIVDDKGRLDHILIAPRRSLPLPHALVMAGGFGRRLGEATSDMPKPLLSIGDRPILDRVLEQLEDAGIGHIHVSVHYLAERVAGFIDARNNRASITPLPEAEPLGTAGALGLIPEPLSGPLLIVNGDVVTKVDFAALHDFHQRHGYDGTVAAAVYEVNVPFGVLQHGADGLFAGIEEKPTYQYFVAAGIYYLSPEIVALVPKGRHIDMPELLELARRAGLKIGLFPVHEYWRDIGRPGDLDAAEADHKNGSSK